MMESDCSRDCESIKQQCYALYSPAPPGSAFHTTISMILDGHVDDAYPVAVLGDDNAQHDDGKFSDNDDLHAGTGILVLSTKT